MDKRTFVNTLLAGLNFMSPAEREEVRQEFEEHFEVGQEMGKTEQELVDQLGEPARIVDMYRQQLMKQAGVESPNDDSTIPPIDLSPKFGNFETQQPWDSDAHDNERRFQAKDVSLIDVQCSSCDIRIQPEDSEIIDVAIDGERVGDIKIYMEHGILHVLQPSKPFNLFSLFEPHIKVRISIPYTFEGELNVRTSSGDVVLGDLGVKALQIITVSGDITLGNLMTDTARLQSTSGDIRTGQFKGNALNLQSMSGDLTLGKVYADMLHVHTTSGDIQIASHQGSMIETHSVSGDLKIGPVAATELSVVTVSGDVRQKNGVWDISRVKVKTTSGDVGADFSDHWMDMRFNTVSGDIRITLPHNSAPFDARLDSISGSMRNQLGYELNAGRIIQAKTVSGDMTIKKG
ncbi:DUF4097 family beta strand repeat-containing protein [Eubacteriales bacterium OttesenSCG-928-N13]|nr:DUF4097 family beta strand repeat-containing protein [Eubacteriales bacterium OttesenSCG-928-N13]